MVSRAFRTYGQRPLLGEPIDGGNVRWWSFEQCGAAAQSIADDLCLLNTENAVDFRNGVVVICAGNHVGWLLVDWACALARLPTVAADCSESAVSTLATVNAAVSAVGRKILAICVDENRASEWRTLDHFTAKGVGDPDGRIPKRGGDFAVFTTTDVYNRLLEPFSSTSRDATLFAPLENESASSGDLLTCLFSFGSTGSPKPLWFDAPRWAEWGERNPPASRRGRIALQRRSIRVSCAAIFGL